MNSRLNKNQTENNENRKNMSLNNRYHLNINFKSVDYLNNYNRYSADSNKVRSHKYFLNNKIDVYLNSLNFRNPSKIIDHLRNSKIYNMNKLNSKYIILSNKKNTSFTNSCHKSNNSNLFGQMNRIKLFKSNSMEDFHAIRKGQTFYSIDNKKSNDLNINISNSGSLYKRIFSNNSPQYNFFKIKNINKIILKNTMLNQRIMPSFRYHKLKTPNYCDASTNTFYEKSIIEKKKTQINIRNKRPLMIDYFESEHKKFCHGFDKYKGRNKNKIPFFIVHKY